MKKLLIAMLVVISLTFGGITTSIVSADCSSAINSWRHEGYLKITTDGDSAMTFIEPLVWNRMTYNQKLGLATCIRKIYRKDNVYLFPLGGSVSDMLGRLKGESDFKLYK